MKHPNIIQFTGYYLGPDLEVAYLVAPYASNGSLDVFLANTSVTELDRLRFVSPNTQYAFFFLTPQLTFKL